MAQQTNTDFELWSERTYQIVVAPRYDRDYVQGLLLQARFSELKDPAKVEALADAVAQGTFAWTWEPIVIARAGSEAARFCEGHHRSCAALWYDAAFRNVIIVYERACDAVSASAQYEARKHLYSALLEVVEDLRLESIELDCNLEITGDVLRAVSGGSSG